MEAVGLAAKAPDILERMSQILGIQQQQQALQGQAADVAGAQQTQRQRSALADYDFMQHIGEDGTIDLNQLASDPELRKAAGDQFLPVLQAAASAKSQQLEAKSKLVGLRDDQRKSFAELMSSLRGDRDIAEDNESGRRKVNDALIQYGQMYGEDSYPVISTYAQGLRSAPKGKLDSALSIIQRQAMDASTQRQSTLPQFANTGGQLQNVNPDVSPSAQVSMPITLGPGEQDVVQVDQLGNPYRVQRTPRGAITSTAPVPGSQNTGPAVFGPGERASLESQAQHNFENISANRKAASMAPQQLDQINRALQLSRGTATGSFAGRRADIESALGSLLPSGFQGLDDASKLNELEKMTERIATDASTVLGINAQTDAQRESIKKQNANIGYTPQAIQNVLEYAKAQTLAMQAKGDAQELWLKKEGNGITKQHDFETEFRQAYDPRVFQLAVMTPDERAEARSKMGKDDATQIQRSAKKLIELGVRIGQ